jgi:hypothetical protein
MKGLRWAMVVMVTHIRHGATFVSTWGESTLGQILTEQRIEIDEKTIADAPITV